MTSNLWIPCYNEGTSDISYCPMNRWPTWEKRHVIYQTLCLLKEQILSGTFQKIIISNDGSDDDTLEGIKRFKREHDLRESVFQIIDGKTNEGKMMRFFEAFEMSGNEEILAMTDADMVFAGGNTFEKLSSPLSYPGERGMTISHQGEYSILRGGYEVYDGSTSGTRGLVISRVKNRFAELDIGTHNILGKGYGLETLLNALFSRPYDSGEYVNSEYGGNIPLFLEPFRKKSARLQRAETDTTLAQITELLKLKSQCSSSVQIASMFVI